jgi:hypothetical protein
MKADLVSTHNQVATSRKPELGSNSIRCERCNAELGHHRATLRGIVLDAICLLVLLAILAPLGYLAEQWIYQHLDRPLRNPLWHEPLDDWGCSQHLLGDRAAIIRFVRGHYRGQAAFPHSHVA